MFGEEYPNTKIIGKINIHDVNNCFNFATNITSTKSTKYLRASKDYREVYKIIIQQLKRC